MRKIKLTQGKYAMVDDEDFEWLNQWKWHARKVCYERFYAYRRVPMHRLIMKAAPRRVIDHINGNSLDNRRSNLRSCTRMQNGSHRVRLDSRNTSGITGVYWHKYAKKWMSSIGHNGRLEYLGLFKSKTDAIKVRKRAANELFKEFSGLI